MDAKTKFGRVFSMLFFGCVFALIFCDFSKAWNLDFAAPVEAKHRISQNQRFRKPVEKMMILEAFLDEKSKKIREKIVFETMKFRVRFF